MRLENPLRYSALLALVCCLFPLMLMQPTSAQQDGAPAPQLLYRSENRLVLLDGYTGETTELPLEISDQDVFTWSPDGQYLLTQLRDAETSLFCINLFDVDMMTWIYEESISCSAFYGTVFSGDGIQIIYASDDGDNGSLWLFDLETETSQELYRTTEGYELNPEGISEIRWSPTESYLTFVASRWIMGGTLNWFVVMDMESKDYFILSEGNPYYASYSPIWSESEDWFLITLWEENVTSANVPHTNHKGDVYMVNSQTGDIYRLTYSPAFFERDVRWTEDGRIAFTVVIEQDVLLTPDEAMNVDVVPDEVIITPEPIEANRSVNSLSNIIVSPDPELGVWLGDTQPGYNERSVELRVGYVYALPLQSDFSLIIPDYRSRSFNIIGWRPSDYTYPQG